MRQHHRRIRDQWAAVIRRAIELGEDDSAYRLTRGLVARLRELGVWGPW